jgi:hypothetical protein
MQWRGDLFRPIGHNDAKLPCVNDWNEYFIVGNTDGRAVGGSVGSINPCYCVK